MIPVEVCYLKSIIIVMLIALAILVYCMNKIRKD